MLQFSKITPYAHNNEKWSQFQLVALILVGYVIYVYCSFPGKVI